MICIFEGLFGFVHFMLLFLRPLFLRVDKTLSGLPANVYLVGKPLICAWWKKDEMEQE